MADTAFITNDTNKKLKGRIAELIGHSKELKFLIGFFYFSGIRELHVVKNGGEIYYVGITSQSISSRLRYGLKADGKHGYHGYKWKDKITQAELLIWSFPGSTQEHVEAIEAELVYFIREKTGKWPKYQMEIHFHVASESERQVAESILSQCLNQ